MSQPNSTTAQATDGLSFGAFFAVLAAANAWFFTQVLSYA